MPRWCGHYNGPKPFWRRGDRHPDIERDLWKDIENSEWGLFVLDPNGWPEGFDEFFEKDDVLL